MNQMSVMLSISIVHTITRSGHSIEPLFSDLKIEKDLMTNPDNLIGTHKYDRLMERAAEICKDPYFGPSIWSKSCF